MATISPDDFLRQVSIPAKNVRSGGQHQISVGGHRVTITGSSIATGSAAIERLCRARGTKYGPNVHARLITASGRTWGTLELLMFDDDLLHIWQFDEAAFLLERAAASLCEADGTPWAGAQAEDKERWRKIAKAVKLAPADSNAWPSEYHPTQEETR